VFGLPGDDGMWILHAEFDATSGAEVQSALDRASTVLFHADGERGGRGRSSHPNAASSRRAHDRGLELWRTGDGWEMRAPP
jgi:hypothetical protein